MAEIAYSKPLVQNAVTQRQQNQDKIRNILNLEGCSNALAQVADLVLRFSQVEETFSSAVVQELAKKPWHKLYTSTLHEHQVLLSP